MTCDYGRSAMASVRLNEVLDYDVIVVDEALPSPDGSHICQYLRKAGAHQPVLTLNQQDALHERLAAFAAGADDCQYRGCHLAELHMRLIALSQRSSSSNPCLCAGELELDLDSRQVKHAGTAQRLSPTACTLLELLIRAWPGHVSRSRLERAVWGDDPPDSNTLNVHMHYLRKVILSVQSGCLIETVHGRGFRLVPEGQHCGNAAARRR
jgi:DNA-binding response OmpR family regulator